MAFAGQKNREGGAVRLRRWLIRLGLVLGSSAASLFAVDRALIALNPGGISLFARYAEFWGFRFGDDNSLLGWSDAAGVFYAPVPGARVVADATYTINEAGYRGPMVGRKKPHGAFRIVCLGDSVTFGSGVDDDAPYPVVLESMLEEQGRGDIEVVNLGVPGFNTSQELYFYEAVGRALQPDLVTILAVRNDWGGWTMRDYYERRIGGWPKKGVLYLPGLWGLWHISRGAEGTGRLWDHRASENELIALGERYRLGTPEERRAIRKQMLGDTGSMHRDRHSDLTPESAVALLHRGRVSKDGHLAVFAQTAKDDKFEDLESECGSLGVPFGWVPQVSVRDSGYRISRIDAHPNAEGHLVMAASMIEQLDGWGLLPPQRDE